MVTGKRLGNRSPGGWDEGAPEPPWNRAHALRFALLPPKLRPYRPFPTPVGMHHGRMAAKSCVRTTPPARFTADPGLETGGIASGIG